MNMEKSKQTLKALIVGLVLLLLGISMIVIGVVLNNHLKTVATDVGEKYSPVWFIYLLEIGGALFFLASFGNNIFLIPNIFIEPLIECPAKIRSVLGITLITSSI